MGEQRLVAQQGEVVPGSFQWIEWSDRRHTLNTLKRSCLWILQHVEDKSNSDDQPFFRIEMPYGEKKPRLLSKRGYTTKMVATTRDADGYNIQSRTLWKIQRIQKLY